MSIIKRNLLETITNYYHATSKDETRLFLNGVNIKRVDDTIIKLRATDGYILLESNHTIEELENFEEITIYNDDIKIIDKMILKDKSLKQKIKFDVIFSDGIFAINLPNDNTLKLVPTHRDFPKTEVFTNNKKFNSSDTIAFNPDYVQNISKSIYGTRKVNGKKLIFSFGKNNTNPMRCEVEHNGINHTAILMPIKHDRPSYMAEPIEEKKETVKEKIPVTFYSGPAHGWLKVPKNIMIDMNISIFSFESMSSYYLEEDMDMGNFIRLFGKDNLNIIDESIENESYIRGLNSVKQTKLCMTEEQFKDHRDSYDGYCNHCNKVTNFGGVEPDAEHYNCEDCCGNTTVMGVENALISGHLIIVEES